MFRWLYVLLHLLQEAASARRDARIRFLKAQVEILRRKLGGNRVIPSPDERLRLLAIGAELKHSVADLIGIVTPQTYSRWVFEQREGRKPKPIGRPKIARNLCKLVKRLARENAGWGYRRILGERRKLRLRVGRSSVRRILKEAGLTPSPHRRGKADETVWRKFIRLHVNTLVACDFFTKSVVTPLGTKLAFCLAFIHVGTRKVFVSPSTYEPHEQWVRQQGRNLLMWLDEHKLSATHLVHDRDTKFSLAFQRQMFDAGIRRVRTPLLAPDANAFAESWIGSLKRECLNPTRSADFDTAGQLEGTVRKTKCRARHLERHFVRARFPTPEMFRFQCGSLEGTRHRNSRAWVMRRATFGGRGFGIRP
jgi:putative transposase